jgi:hypothetical protein
VNVYLPDGKLADSWGFTGYGTSPSQGLSSQAPLSAATALAMRDAGAKLAVEFREQAVMRGLLPESASADAPPPVTLPAPGAAPAVTTAPTETPAPAEPPATPPAPTSEEPKAEQQGGSNEPVSPPPPEPAENGAQQNDAQENEDTATEPVEVEKKDLAKLPEPEALAVTLPVS